MSTGLLYGLVHKHQIDYVNVIVVDLWGGKIQQYVKIYVHHDPRSEVSLQMECVPRVG